MNDLTLSITLVSVSIIILPFAIRETYRTIKEEFFDVRPSKIKLEKKQPRFDLGFSRNFGTY